MADSSAKPMSVASNDRASHGLIRRVVAKFVRLAMSGSALALADQALVSGASFLTTVLIGRYTFPSELGTYALAGAVVIWVTNAQESLVSLPYTLRKSSGAAQAAVQSGQALILCILLSALAMIAIGVVGITVLPSDGHLNMTLIAWALAGAMPFVICREFARRFAFAALRNIEALLLDSAVVILQIGMLGWLAWTGQMTSAAALAALGISCGAAVLIWFWLVRDRFQFSFDGFAETLTDSWFVGKWLFANQLLAALQSQITLWCVAFLLGAAATGIYVASLSIAMFANPIILGISNVLWAKAAHAFQQGGSRRLLRESIADAAQLGAIVGVFFVAILLWGEDLLNLLYPWTAYADHGHIVAIFALGQLIYGLGMPASTALASMGHVRTNFIIAAMETVLIALLVWPLVFHWGVVGAAYGLLIACIIRFFVRWAALLCILRSAERAVAYATGMEKVVPVLRRLMPNVDPSKVQVLDLDGCQGRIFAATHDKPGSEIDATYIIKLYRPERNPDIRDIHAQYESLGRVHAALNGRVFHGWTICVPAPVLVSDEPLALVMTRAPGRKLVECLHERAAIKQIEHPAALAFSSAIITLWAAGLSHGDLNLANVLCDEQTQTLSFVDCGPKPECQAYAEAFCWWDLATHDLAHLLSHEGETLLDTWGRQDRLRQRQLFVEGVLRAVLAIEPSHEGKTALLTELGHCARAHLAAPAPVYSHLGLWQLLKRNMTLRRMKAILQRMQQEIGKKTVRSETLFPPTAAATGCGHLSII